MKIRASNSFKIIILVIFVSYIIIYDYFEEFPIKLFGKYTPYSLISYLTGNGLCIDRGSGGNIFTHEDCCPYSIKQSVYDEDGWVYSYVDGGFVCE
jgi:hypothetical protein